MTPQIGFDTPGFDGRGAAQVDIDPAEWERLKALGAIVMEPWETYYAGL
ncbi:MAG: hypothetical protein LBJ08_05180 [Bifidobacteriaceae bacterium]|nr:hypothetical protein [Bifidobacteriaceae bacterium]